MPPLSVNGFRTVSAMRSMSWAAAWADEGATEAVETNRTQKNEMNPIFFMTSLPSERSAFILNLSREGAVVKEWNPACSEHSPSGDEPDGV
jgi:hypothetical protein